MNSKNRQILDYMTKVAIFSALSFVLYLFPKFPLPFFPSFLEIQFSNLPAILGGFALGPVGGALIVAIRTVIKLPLSSTACVGELADCIIGLATVMVSSLIYQKFKTKKGGIIALICGVITWTTIAIIANAFILIPFYAKFFMGEKGIAGLVMITQDVLPNVTVENFIEVYVVYAALPFNLLLSTTVSVITFLVYKRISIVFKKDFIKRGK